MSTGVSDRDAARVLLRKRKAVLSRLKRIWADQVHTGDFIDWVQEQLGWHIKIVSKLAGQVGFVPLPRRWVVASPVLRRTSIPTRYSFPNILLRRSGTCVEAGYGRTVTMPNRA